MKEVILGGKKYPNMIALVDDEDYKLIKNFSWCPKKRNRENTFYAVTNILDSNGKRKSILLHRFIMGAEDGQLVDHKNRNSLDCQKHNLRFANFVQNSVNREKNTKNISGYRGVSYNKTNKKWYARIRINGIQKNIGSFSDKESAARIYDRVAKEEYGDFAVLNFM